MYIYIYIYVYTVKEKVTLTLLRLSQLRPNDTMSLPIELPFLLYLIACVQCVGCPQTLSRECLELDM